MSQPIENRRPPEYYRDKLKMNAACKYINAVVEGEEEPDALRLSAAKYIIDKRVASPKQIEVSGRIDVVDINACNGKLIEAGLDPDQIWQALP
jgi:hypothetical protein